MEFATNPLIPGRVALVLSPPVLRRLTGGLRQLAGPERDYGAIDPDRDPAMVVEDVLSMQPSGIIMEFREELTEALSSLGRPVVVVLADLLLEGMGCVNVDDHAVGRMAGEYLWRKGLRNFGFYGFASVHAPERETGFLEALREQDIEATVCAAQENARARRASGKLENWIKGLPRPVGIFAAHDPLAREVMDACRRLGLQVPAEVAVLSASNDQYTCELVYPGISSVEIPWEQLGLQAGRLLEQMLAGQQPPDEPVVVTPTGIHTRGSTDFYRVSDERIQRAVGFMRDHLGEAVGIDAVVRAIGMDRRAMERLFRAQLNRSPKQVLTDMRTDRARELLGQSNLRIGEIAEHCGFSASEQLATAFRKRFGKTPRQWRRG